MAVDVWCSGVDTRNSVPYFCQSPRKNLCTSARLELLPSWIKTSEHLSQFFGCCNTQKNSSAQVRTSLRIHQRTWPWCQASLGSTVTLWWGSSKMYLVQISDEQASWPRAPNTKTNRKYRCVYRPRTDLAAQTVERSCRQLGWRILIWLTGACARQLASSLVQGDLEPLGESACVSCCSSYTITFPAQMALAKVQVQLLCLLKEGLSFAAVCIQFFCLGKRHEFPRLFTFWDGYKLVPGHL